MRPLVLDLCCCDGGASMGYYRAGFDVIGVDVKPRRRYPFPFIRANALDVLQEIGANGCYTWKISRGGLTFIRPDLIHESWPCQHDAAITKGTNGHKREQYPNLVPPGRGLTEATGIPFVIEQPQGHGGRIRTDLRLCMDMFKDRIGPPPWVQRHRDFELHGFSVPQPPHPAGPWNRHDGYVRGHRHGVVRSGASAPYVAAYGNGGGKATVDEMRHALGIDWTDEHWALREAIPPVYTELIGRAFLMSRPDAATVIGRPLSTVDAA